MRGIGVKRPAPAVGTGDAVQFFHAADPAEVADKYVHLQRQASKSDPLFFQSHGWLNGRLQEGTLQKASSRFNPANKDTWPLVVPDQDILFTNRYGSQIPAPLGPIRLPLSFVRAPREEPPLLSLIYVRWGGTHRVGETGGEETEPEDGGGWGKFGCPPCDWYISGMIDLGFLRHPQLGDASVLDPEASSGTPRDFEIFALFVANSEQTRRVAPLAKNFAAQLRGSKRASFWMLWPAEWEDWEDQDPDFAGYVERLALFSAMRACESAGIRSSFPHPADQYELITSKSWMATLSEMPQAHLPAAILVQKKHVEADLQAAAKRAIAKLNDIRANSPFPSDGSSQPAPSLVNKDGVKKGVVKLGWSWEARYVSFFNGEQQLAARLREMLMCKGCLASECIVQEWVDFDFEMRLFFLPPREWAPPVELTPTRIEFNGWKTSTSPSPGAFTKLSRDKCLACWAQDTEALNSAQQKAVEVSQFLLAWLYTKDPEPFPMVRMDFMLRRLGPGVARVVFGEFCEMGACCLAWADGPPTIWRSALDYALR